MMCFRYLFYYIKLSFASLAFLLIMTSTVCEAGITEVPIHHYENLSSGKIINDLKNGRDINYNNTIIYGDINLSDEKITNIHSSIKFTNSIFINDANFKGAIFNKSAIFEDTIFEKDAIFEDIRFEREVSFAGCKFNSASDFENISLNNEAFFSRTIFNEVANFQHSKFSNYANFDSAKFLKLAKFKYSQFQFANFMNAEFYQGIDFFSTTFNGEADFDEATFKKRSAFYNSEFRDDLSFNGANIKYMIYFDNETKFQKNLDFSNSIINILWIDESAFAKGSQISLNNSYFVRLIANWFIIKEHLYYNPTVYQALIKNYHELRQFDYEDDCYYLLRENELNKYNLLDDILYITCGFGVKLHFTIIISILIVFLFSLFFWATNCLMRPSDIKTYDQTNHISLLDTFYFSLMNFASTSSEFKPIGEYRWLLAAEKIMGWMMMAILFYTLARMGIR